MIYIIFAIAYFVLTSTCLTGATLIKGLFRNDGDEDYAKAPYDSSTVNSGKYTMKSNGIAISKKLTAKKASTPLLKSEKKEF